LHKLLGEPDGTPVRFSRPKVEDVVQDLGLRYSAARPAEIRSPKAYLTTIARRLALDRLKSARSAREQYVGPWLPEPVREGQPDPERSLVLAESLTLAFIVLLDTLSPEERAVFLLREMLESSYPEIASVIGVSEANCASSSIGRRSGSPPTSDSGATAAAVLPTSSLPVMGSMRQRAPRHVALAIRKHSAAVGVPAQERAMDVVSRPRRVPLARGGFHIPTKLSRGQDHPS
jgi:RNA polymerase sigma factor (sigma-70 family)